MFGTISDLGRRHRRPGSPKRRLPKDAAKSAFTLIEMVVVITIIALMAGLILPNMAAIRYSQKLRALAAAIKRFPLEARNQAAKTNDVVTLTVDGDSLVLSKISADTGESQEIDRLQFGGAMQAMSAQKGSDSTDAGTWKWQAYPDGTSDEGGIVFQVGKSQQSLWIPKTGNAYWIDGSAMPKPTDNNWQAGQLLQRATTTGGGGNGQ